MSSLSNLTLLAFIIYVTMGVYAYNKMKKSKESRLFLILCTSLSIWSFGYIFVYNTNSEFWVKFSAFGWCTFSAIILQIILTITDNKLFKNIYAQFLIYIPAMFLIYVRVFVDWKTINSSMLIYKSFSFVNLGYNIGYQLISLFFVVLWGIKQSRIRERRQAITIFVASSISFILNLMSQITIPYIGIKKLSPCGHIYAMSMIIGIYYASQRYNFLKVSSDILFDEIFEEMMDIFFLISSDGKFDKVNGSALELLGYSYKNILKLSLEDIFEEKEIVKKIKNNGTEKTQRLYAELNCITYSGERVPVSISSSVILDKITKEVIGIVVIGRDMTLIKRLEEEINRHEEIVKELRESEERFRVMFNKHSAIKLLIEPETLRIYSANESAQEFYGYTAEEFSTMKISDLNMLSQEDVEDIINKIIQKKDPVLFMNHKLSNGEIRSVEVHAASVPFKDKVMIYSIIHDITERKKAEEKIKYLAYHDNLTELTNRKYFVEALEKEIQVKEIRNDFISVIFIDLNGFKSINDTYGHEAGDYLLCEVGKRFKACVKEKDVVSRFGGDEFALLIYDIKDISEIDKIVEDIFKQVQLPIIMSNSQLSIKASIGRSIFPGSGLTVDELLNKADKEMYIMKKSMV